MTSQPFPDLARPGDERSGLAVASLVVSLCGFVGLCCLGLGGVVSLVGAILGHVASAQARRSHRAAQRFAQWGVLLGWTGFVVGAVILATIVTRLAASPEITVPSSVACWFLPCDPGPNE